METLSHSPTFLRQRRLYTVLPVLVLPFLTLLFWSARPYLSPQAAVAPPGGLNPHLPEAFLKEKDMDKLAYYRKATEDSLKRLELLRKDPYRQLPVATPARAEKVLQGLDGGSKPEKPVIYRGQVYTDPGEAKVYAKLNELEAALATSAEPRFRTSARARGDASPGVQPSPEKLVPLSPPAIQPLPVNPELLPWETRMAGLNPEPDPEIQELQALLDKIISIQHPQPPGDSLRPGDELPLQPECTVTLARDQVPVARLEAAPNARPEHDRLGPASPQHGFFSLDDEKPEPLQNALPAVVHQDQTLVSGATVKLRLTADVYLSGQLVPEGSFLYGTASIRGERLRVEVGSIRRDNALFPVKLSVYDLDGMEGIYVPGALGRTVAKQSLSQDLQGLNLEVLNPSLGAQAVQAGLQTARTFLGRKTRLVQVTVKAGYQVLLRDHHASAL
ncbi:hypothetical protein GCM10027275_42950 [Rhabdobacter roseus]|uniref:Conjugative transposon TraM C-terminal domain-containing protein n=1 Tax=Rhabdobacter roseus TaxID=1655419 RepID=A0A840TRU9_9BACT|nr:conjugative transposon protein TraM [Rhabdobacter roseus]MBB5286651.1 hypothetical protein [Rhabdobacter roseus]